MSGQRDVLGLWRITAVRGRRRVVDDVTLSVAPGEIVVVIGPNGASKTSLLENNMLFFKVVKGKRTILQTIRGVSNSTRTWHTLTGTIAGKELTVELDGKERFKRALDREPTGRCGLWSKADSKVLFDDFEAKP